MNSLNNKRRLPRRVNQVLLLSEPKREEKETKAPKEERAARAVKEAAFPVLKRKFLRRVVQES